LALRAAAARAGPIVRLYKRHAKACNHCERRPILPTPRIYLDHAATTPMMPAARAAMTDGFGRWANPSSPHSEGRAARAALEDARKRIKAALGWRHELVFTSGATESAAIALTRTAIARPALASAVEHNAVLGARADARIMPVDRAGRVELPPIPGRAIVVVQHANNETGILQTIEQTAAAVAAAGGILFVDAAQTAGKLPLPEADLIAVSAHKLGGPPGVGALLVRDLGLLAPLGQGQERGYRAGTENLPAILGFAAALDCAPRWITLQAEWRNVLDDLVIEVGGEVIGAESPRIPTIAAYRLPGLSAEAQLIRFDMAGFAVSAGSACSSGSLHTSHVLTALGLGEQAAREVIRVSFGWSTTREDVEAFAAAYAQLASARRAA
jgi:cysteine desulfurase